MAKKYFTFDNLRGFLVGKFKPAGTLGRHFATIEKNTTEVVVVRSFDNKKQVSIKPGWTLGYNCGEIWGLCPPEQIKNPLHRWLRERKIPKSAIVRTDEPIEYGYDIRVCGAGSEFVGEKLRPYGGKIARSGLMSGVWTGGTVGVVTYHSIDRNFQAPRSKVLKIVIRSGVSDADAVAILEGKHE